MTVQDEPQFALVPSQTDKMILAGQLANEKAASNVFADHMRHKSEETKKAYQFPGPRPGKAAANSASRKSARTARPAHGRDAHLFRDACLGALFVSPQLSASAIPCSVVIAAPFDQANSNATSPRRVRALAKTAVTCFCATCSSGAPMRTRKASDAARS